MQIQRGLKSDSVLTKFVLGAHPIIEHFIKTIRIREIMSTYMRSDKRMKLDDDKVLTLLIHNIITTSNPLYEMGDWLKPLDSEKLGLSPQETKFIQDDKIGMGLFRFYTSRHKDVFFRLALRIIKVFELDCSRIHHNTTTVTFAGKYAGWSAQELRTHGKNKDHRPDLKQLVLGLNVTADGAVPISHQIYGGNQTDDRLHPANHKALQKLLQRVDFIYEELRKIEPKLNSYNLKQRKQIAARIESIHASGQCQGLIQYEIQATREYKQTYQKKGRPTKDTPKKVTWKNFYSILFAVDQEAVKTEMATDGVFPLITNLDAETHPAKKVLEIYKFQPFLEKRHTQLKTYQEIAPVYLKKAERVVAFLHIHVMGLMVASLIERTLHLAMRKKGISSLPIYPENRPCDSPTMFDIVRLFRYVERYEVTAGDDTMVFPAELTKAQKEVLTLLGVPIAGYQ